jgi:hypothetical protein
MKALLKPGGFVVLTHEISVKPSNPFHMFFADEEALCKVVRQHFDRVDRIDACEVDPGLHVRNFTAKGDCPDFVAWRKND